MRGFNPGGNHGSFLRISTHSVLMAAGGGVPAGLEIDRPYDSLSLTPTLLSLLLVDGLSTNYPGPAIEEITSNRVGPLKKTRSSSSRRGKPPITW